MRCKIKEGILYLSLHNVLVKAYPEMVISRKVVHERLGRHFLIPKNLRDLVLKEMKEKGLLDYDRRKVILSPLVIDLHNDVHKLYELAGLYGKEDETTQE